MHIEAGGENTKEGRARIELGLGTTDDLNAAENESSDAWISGHTMVVEFITNNI